MQKQCIEPKCGAWYDALPGARKPGRCYKCRQTRRTAQQGEYRDKLKRAGISRSRHYKNGVNCWERSLPDQSQSLPTIHTYSKLMHSSTEDFTRMVNNILAGTEFVTG